MASKLARHGAVRPTIYDVARDADVSIKTVSRVANGAPGVSPKTRRMVLSTIDRLGYVASAAARSLVTGTSDAIGVIVDSIADPFFAALVSVVESHLLTAGFSVQVASTGLSAERERDQISRMARANVRGVVLAPTTGSHEYLASALGNIPAVLVDRGWDGSGLDTVGVQDRAGARMATECFVARGHRRIAFLGDVWEHITTIDRRLGYLDALAGAGLHGDPALIRARFSSSSDPAGDAVGELLALPEPPTAIFSSNARTTVGAVRRLHGCRRTDIALIGFGDFDLADALDPGVTVVDHDPRTIAAVATERLLARIHGQALTPADITVPISITVRGSGELAPCSPP